MIPNDKLYRQTRRLVQRSSTSFLTRLTRRISNVFSSHFSNISSKYSPLSFAVLQNFPDINAAVQKSDEYRIPLMQIVLKDDEGEQILLDQLLANFQIAQILNQSFVIYGDWEPHKELFIEDVPRRSMLFFSKGPIVFAEMELDALRGVSRQKLQATLIQIRHIFYQEEELGYIKSPQKELAKIHVEDGTVKGQVEKNSPTEDVVNELSIQSAAASLSQMDSLQ